MLIYSLGSIVPELISSMEFPKKEPKLISVGLNPIMIVGEKMGKQRKGQDKYALEGNGTGDFIHEVIEGLDNIILTNIDNHYYPGSFNHKMKHLDSSLNELNELIIKHQPNGIIALGGIAEKYLIKLGYRNSVVPFAHPSWINRFKRKSRPQYINLLKKIINVLNKSI